MGKPVIVPDLPVFRDEMVPNPAGWFFRAGDAADLAQPIEAAFADAAGLASMGARAREYAVSERSCGRYVVPIVGSLGGASSQRRLFYRFQVDIRAIECQHAS